MKAPDAQRLHGRVAIVTGGGSGIGRGIAELFAAEGARVVIVDVDSAAARSACSDIVEAGGTARAEALDVSDEDAAVAAVRQTVADWGRVNILVTAAAISVGKTVIETTVEDWERVFAANVRGTFVWIKSVLPEMVAKGAGSIITVGSQIALAGGRNSASYIASKGAVISLTRAVALDFAEAGIRANVLVPGAIDTPLLRRSFTRQGDPEAARKRAAQRHAMGRLGTVDECAQAALFLASDDSTFTTGALLPVDGGWLIA